MATKFHIGRGSVFSVSTDGGTTWTPVKQLKTINFSGEKNDFEDITNMDSIDSEREFTPTLGEAGTAALQGVFLDSDPGQIEIAAARVAKALLNCRLQMVPRTGQTTGFKREFLAYVQDKGGPDAQVDKSSTFSSTLKITGGFTDTAGS